MYFLLFLIAIIIIVKFIHVFRLEGFNGSCIQTFSPDFTSSMLTYKNIKDLYQDSSDISIQLITYQQDDLSATKINEDISGFMQDPLNKDYPYYNPTCTLSYIDYD